MSSERQEASDAPSLASCLASLLALLAPALARAQGPASGGNGISAFRATHGSAWRLQRDTTTGRPRSLSGGSFPFTPRVRAFADVSGSELVDASRAFLRR